MKMLLNLFLLVGMSPGTFLPSSITDQLIAPAVSKAKTTKDAAPIQTEELPVQKEGADPSQRQSASGVPATYSAIRPTGFQFTKGDIRTILTPQGGRVARFFLHCLPPLEARDGLSRYASIMEPDFCGAHEAAVTSPEICAHAPPVQS